MEVKQKLNEATARRGEVEGRMEDCQREMRLTEGKMEEMRNSNNQMEIELEVSVIIVVNMIIYYFVRIAMLPI